MRKRTTVSVIIVLAATLAAGAQEAALPPMYLNFAVAGYLSLYPEANYGNPAVILQLTRPVLFNSLYSSGTAGSTLQTRTIGYGGAGAIGGTNASSTSTSLNGLAVDGFLPVNKVIVTGFNARLNLGFDCATTEQTNWTANPQSLSTELTDNTQSWLAGGYFAARLAGVDVGARLALDGSHDPWSGTWRTDPTVNGGAAYILGGLSDPTKVFELMPRLDLGGVYLRDPFTIGLTASVLWDMVRNTEFRAVDKDGNGFDESVVTLEEWRTTTAAWADGPRPEYALKDQADEVLVALTPWATWALNPRLTLLATGSASLWDGRSIVACEHLVSTDLSVDRIDVTYPHFSATVGAAFAASPACRLRAGIGYTGSGSNQVDNSLDGTGASNFLAANTGHYVEAALGAAPNNADVSGQVNTGTDTFNTFAHAIQAIAVAEYTPAPRVLLFAGAGAGYVITVDTYRVFNTDDNAVWQEVQTSGGLSIQYSLLLGVGLAVSDTTFVGVRTKSGSLATSRVLSDGLPTAGGVVSAGTAPLGGNLSTPGSGSWSVDLYCVIGL